MKLSTLIVAGVFTFVFSLSAWPQDNVTGEKFPLPDDLTKEVPTAIGTLAIQAIQGTPGADPIRNSKVTIKLYHRTQLFSTIEAQLDEFGVTLIEDLPLGMSTQPVVQILHDDMTYQRIGTVMDATSPYQKIEVTCYDATDEMPPWKVSMRHVMIDRTTQGLLVKEVINIDNPGERTWLGAQTNDDHRTTTSFTIPAGAENLTLGKGFHDWCCTDYSDGRIVNHLPLMPDKTEMSFTYVVPINDGKATITIAAPVDVEHLMIVVPDGLIADEINGLVLGGTQQIGERLVRYYTASNQQVDEVKSISLTGLGGDVVIAKSGNSMLPIKIVAAIGGGMLLLITMVVVFVKSPKDITNGS